VVGLVAGLSADTLAFVTTTSFVAPGYFSGGTVSIPGVPGGSNAVWSSQCLHRDVLPAGEKLSSIPPSVGTKTGYSLVIGHESRYRVLE